MKRILILGKYAAKKLTDRKVDVRMNTTVKALSDKGVELSDGSTVRSVNLIWTAGVTPNPLVRALP